LEFWNGFKEYAEKKSNILRFRKTTPEHWYDISIGSSHAHVSLKTILRDEEIRCELWIDSPIAKQVFDVLQNETEEIEKQIGHKLDWKRLDEGKASRIILATQGKLENTTDWQRQYEWLLQYAELFAKTFSNRLKGIAKE